MAVDNVRHGFLCNNIINSMDPDQTAPSVFFYSQMSEMHLDMYSRC